jgi:hypothetical protein
MNESAEPKIPPTKSVKGPMAMCPMAKMCMGMMEKRPSRFLLTLPGGLFIVLGVLIVVEPKILVWLIATASVLMGIMMLMMAGFIRRIGGQMRM